MTPNQRGGGLKDQVSWGCISSQLTKVPMCWASVMPGRGETGGAWAAAANTVVQSALAGHSSEGPGRL